jgi:hypothetical protein
VFFELHPSRPQEDPFAIAHVALLIDAPMPMRIQVMGLKPAIMQIG